MPPRDARRTTFRPVPLWVSFIVATSAALVTGGLARGTQPDWLPPLWVEVDAAPRSSIVVLGPLLAAVGAWVGGWTHTAAIGPTAARGGAVLRAQAWPLALACTTGQAVGLAPAIFDTQKRATGGSS